MWRCTWGAAGHRIWGSVGSGARGSGAHGLCSLPAAPRPGGSWLLKAASPGRWGAPRAQSSGIGLDVTVPQDIILYRYDRHRAFIAVGFFCVAQAGFWGYLAYLAFDSFRDSEEPPPGQKEEKKKKKKFPLAEGLEGSLDAEKWRFGFTGACLAAGILIVGSASLFSRRSIKQILLHRGGHEVSLTTYYPFGFTSTFTVPLRQVSCLAHRLQDRPIIPVKVKKRSFYYLIDKQGHFTDTNLFDLTVGAYRQL